MPLKTYPLILLSSSSHLNPNIFLFGLIFMLLAAFADGTKDKGKFVEGSGAGGKIVVNNHTGLPIYITWSSTGYTGSYNVECYR